MGMRGARRGDSSEWVRYLWVNQSLNTACSVSGLFFVDQVWIQRHTKPPAPRHTKPRPSCAAPSHVPVSRVLVQLAELPVDGEDVHVVVLLEIVSQQIQRVVASLQPLLVLVDLPHLRDGTNSSLSTVA